MEMNDYMRLKNVAIIELVAACMVVYYHSFALSGGGRNVLF